MPGILQICTSAVPTPMTSSGPAPTATTSSSSPASTATCDPSSKVPATAPACVKKCATIKIKEGYCTDKNVFNQAYQQCLKYVLQPRPTRSFAAMPSTNPVLHKPTIKPGTTAMARTHPLGCNINSTTFSGHLADQVKDFLLL
ncbi:uncharacterized protein MELLADRAFT_90457 [Melampsora larici-populina 98AG31]|uniref:Uncharacterized protein n=1 Tax=Melampsora larici-populina (strain 98AG31 / pathotype 3-4-7) TaxID=747676 RepID=F4RX09_MELLP|nr:uncharacterized protein MELLADRAFT_90457 [Melampsora larici-populina 98AG31]EGG03112.1 hypothetical protein MELLADRAFT_90457 [Melampsora larici-populina 98AG31]